MRVRDWMTPEPATVREDCSALEAFDVMVDRGVRHLPVVAAGDRLVGIASLDDLRAAFPVELSLQRPPSPGERRGLIDYTVADAMTWVPQIVAPDAPIEEAARRLADHRIGCLPVVEGDRLVGILSETDVLRAFVTKLSAAPDAEEGPVAELREERRRLVGELERWQNAERELSADLHDEPRDAADRASDERDVARLESISERAARRLRVLERAIERAERGRFGVCERCGASISAQRLRALPETALCVRCARESVE